MPALLVAATRAETSAVKCAPGASLLSKPPGNVMKHHEGAWNAGLRKSAIQYILVLNEYPRRREKVLLLHEAGPCNYGRRCRKVQVLPLSFTLTRRIKQPQAEQTLRRAYIWQREEHAAAILDSVKLYVSTAGSTVDSLLWSDHAKRHID